MSTFYNKFKEEERKEQEQNLQQKNVVQEPLQQAIFIENKSTFKSFIRFLISAFLFVIKGLFYIGITVFSSIGLTVLLNENLRNSFINFVKAVFWKEVIQDEKINYVFT